MLRILLSAILVAVAAPAAAQVTGALPPPQASPTAPAPPLAPPALKRSITVTSDIVRLGDLIDNAGGFAAIPVFRSPDLGTTGRLAAPAVERDTLPPPVAARPWRRGRSPRGATARGNR